MSYQKIDSESQIEVVSEEKTFFSNGNKLRMFALFIAGVVAVCVVLATQNSNVPSKVTMLAVKSKKEVSQKIKYSFQSDTVDSLLAKYGLTIDKSKLTKKKSVAHAGAYSAAKPVWGAPAKSFIWGWKYPGQTCDREQIPYGVMGISKNECLPMGMMSDDDYVQHMGGVFSCDDEGDIVMTIYNTLACDGDAVGAFPLTEAETCSDDGNQLSSTFISCVDMDVSSYPYDIKKTWMTPDPSADTQCQASSPATLDSTMFEAYPTDNCVPKGVVDDSASLLFTYSGGSPLVQVYEGDSCDGDFEPYSPSTTCEVTQGKTVTTAEVAQYNPGK